jgi:hypothetical protein
LLGVGAVALAAGVLAGANALAGRSDIDTVSVSGATAGGFSGTMPNGQPFVTGGGTTGGGTTGGGSTGGTGGATGGSTGGATKVVVDPSIAAASKKFQDASANLNAVLDKMSGVPTFDPARFRAAEERDRGATYNINVTGAFDREATAREIVNTINDSFYRGTGGANNLQIA